MVSQYAWEPNSTYIKAAPYFENISPEPKPLQNIHNARVLVLLGDSVTTDHISPAGSFSEKSPAGEFLISLGVEKKDFNQYGARRGNHEIMMRGTFANIRLKNLVNSRDRRRRDTSPILQRTDFNFRCSNEI